MPKLFIKYKDYDDWLHLETLEVAEVIDIALQVPKEQFEYYKNNLFATLKTHGFIYEELPKGELSTAKP